MILFKTLDLDERDLDYQILIPVGDQMTWAQIRISRSVMPTGSDMRTQKKVEFSLQPEKTLQDFCHQT